MVDGPSSFNRVLLNQPDGWYVHFQLRIIPNNQKARRAIIIQCPALGWFATELKKLSTLLDKSLSHSIILTYCSFVIVQVVFPILTDYSGKYVVQFFIADFSKPVLIIEKFQ